MKSISITTYRGFSKVKGKCSLQELIGWVRSRQYANLIEKIGRLVSEGKTKEAENVKRQLDYFTVTANYHECRLAHSIAAYNDTSTIDIDKLREEELERIRALIEADEATLACFLTAKQHGFKILAYLTDLEAEAWRNSFFKTATITYDTTRNCCKQRWTPAEKTCREVSSPRMTRRRFTLPKGWHASPNGHSPSKLPNLHKGEGRKRKNPKRDRREISAPIRVWNSTNASAPRKG